MSEKWKANELRERAAFVGSRLADDEREFLDGCIGSIDQIRFSETTWFRIKGDDRKFTDDMKEYRDILRDPENIRLRSGYHEHIGSKGFHALNRNLKDTILGSH